MTALNKTLLAVASLIICAQAGAATATWSMTTGSNVGTIGTTDWGNTRQFTNNGVTVTASAWSNTCGSSNTLIRNAYLSVYGNSGLGVINRDGGTGAGKDANDVIGNGTEHAMDNDERYDSIMLTFSEAVNLTSVRNGWYSNDSDLSILAFVGSGSASINGSTYASLVGNGWSNVATLSNPGTTETSTGNSTTYSKYWLVGAFNTAFGDSDPGNGALDYVKFAGIVGKTCTGTVAGGSCNPGNTGSVPEPGSLALAGLGLLGVIGLRRRRK